MDSTTALSMFSPLRILQWNILGLKANLATLLTANAEDPFDILVLQETLLSETSTCNIKNYNAFHSYYMPGQNRGISIFTKNSLHTQLITPAPECGARIECLGIQISLNESNLFLFNIYRTPHPTCELEMDELFGLAAHEPTIILGDFNAHHPNWNDPTTSSAYKTNDAGLHIKLLLDSFPDVSLLNSKQATHTKGGVLDLTILSNSLVSTADWSFHPYLMSDHLATFTTLQLPRLPLPPPVPRWNLKKANWAHFTKLLEDWAERYTPANNLHQLEQDFVAAIKEAADISIPKVHHTYHAN